MPTGEFGRYRNLEPLGAGGMGEVFLAYDPTLERNVALKFLDDELQADDTARERLLGEARAASALNHPHVCTIYEVGEEDGRWYIAMEYVEGRPLNEIIARGSLAAERIESYGVQIADAISHAHARGVIHRDLKSANVMVTRDGRAKVLDFGLAVKTGVEAEAATQSRVAAAESGTVSGTLPYMAPEVLRGGATDERSDIWALGVILYEMAAERLPFAGATAFEITSSILKDSARLPSEVPAGLRAIIHRCLSKSPGERYQSAAEVRAALEAVQSATGDIPVVVDVARKRPAWITRAWVGAVVVVVIAGFLWAFSGRGRSRNGGGAGVEGLAIGTSGRPALAVLDFDDLTGNEQAAWLASGVPSMLQTGLAQTPGLDIVSNRRVHEIMHQLGEERLDELDLATLGEIARRSGVGAVIVGAVYAVGDNYRIDVQVEDVSTGHVITAHTATGPDVFTLVDDLAARVRGGLELDLAASETSIAEITTDSLEAWRYYNDGLEAQRNLRRADARDAFQRAVELDPEFALARVHLLELSGYLLDENAQQVHEAALLEHIDRLPERDRLAFLAATAYRREDDPERAAELYEDVLRRYPDFEDAYVDLSLLYGGILRQSSKELDLLARGVSANPSSGQLRNQYGYALFEVGRYAEALRQIEEYAALNPSEPNPLDSLAEMHLQTGQPQRAIEIYNQASEVDPDWPGSFVGRATAYAMLGRYDEALDEMEHYGEYAVSRGGLVASGYAHGRALLLNVAGRYREAVEAWRGSLRSAAERQDPAYANVSRIVGAQLGLQSGDFPLVRELAGEVIDSLPRVQNMLTRRQMSIGAHSLMGVAAARSGDLKAARLQLTELQETGDREVQVERWYLESLRGEIELAAGRPAESSSVFRAAEPELKMDLGLSLFSRAWVWNNCPWRDGTARAMLAQGDVRGAIAEYRRLLTPSMTAKFTSFLEPRYVLELARLLEETGDTEAAAAEYERFANLWKDADAQYQPLVEEARQKAADLADPSVVTELFDRAERELGPVEMLVNNAADYQADTFLPMDSEPSDAALWEDGPFTVNVVSPGPIRRSSS